MPPPPSIRRRWVRRLLWGGATLACGGVVALGVLCVPAVQTWIAERAVASQPGWQLEAERIGVGLRGLEARGLDFSMPGIRARSAPLAVRVQASELLRRRLVVTQVAVDDLVIEVTPSAMESSDEPLAGLLELLHAPLAWTVAKTAIQGRVDVREGGETLATGDLTLSGGGIAAGRPGVFNYEFGTASVLLPAAPDNVIRSRGTVRITQDGSHGIGSVELEGDLRLPRYGAVELPAGKLTVQLEKTSAGETYHLGIAWGDEARIDVRASIAPGATHAPIAVAFFLKPEFLARIEPKLAGIGALRGEVNTEVDLVTFAPVRSRLEVGSEDGPFRFAVAQDGTADKARVTLEALPLAWANPWLAESGAAFAGGVAAGEWDAVLAASGAVEATSVKPMKIGPITLAGEKIPSLLPILLTLDTRVSANEKAITFATEAFEATTEKGDTVAATLRVEHGIADGRTRASGSLTGALPTLLAGPDRPLPFVVTARWDAAQEGEDVRVDALEFIARKDAASAPVVSLALQQPIRAGASLASLKTDATQDLLRFAVNGLPLSWVSRWLPDFAVSGTWAEGESTLRYAADGAGFVLATRVPWSFTDVEIAAGGKPVFDGAGSFAPEFSYNATRQAAELRSLHAEDASGNRLDGSAMFEWKPEAKTFATTLALDATLPALPHSEGAFGAVTAAWRSRASTADGAVSQIEHLSLDVRNADGSLLTVNATQPVLFARKPSGELILHSMEPLRVKTAAMPLAWMRPWFPAGVEADGTLAETELELHAEPQRFRLRPVKPLRIDGLSVKRDGAAQIGGASAAFSPGADVLVIHQLRPAFQLVAKGNAYATEGWLDAGGRRAAEFDANIGFLGNTEVMLPQTVDFQARAELAALSGAFAGLPTSGSVVARLNGDLLGTEPLEFWARLEGVEAADKAVLAPMEIVAQGKVDGRASAATFDVGIQHFTTPTAGDAAFRIKLGLDSGLLNFDSALRSRFLDMGAMLKLAEALDGGGTSVGKPVSSTPAETTPAQIPEAGPVKTPARLAQLGVPFWSVLRGQFDLQLDAVKFEPYRIEDVRGRLDVTERRLSLTGLTGTMFAGKWSGGLHIDYDPQPHADHFMTGGFRIEQFDTARVVQTVFPNEFGSFDARINLDAAVRGDGNGLWELMERAEGEFAIEGRGGVARLTHPSVGTASTLLVLGGTVSFSPELRALGRLLRKFAEMPVNELRVSGERDAQGGITLTEFWLDSPQARLVGRGAVPATGDVALAGRPLELGLELFAKDEVGVILGNMKLLEKRTTTEGYRKMTERFSIGGEVGRPDASALYDLLARGALGSRGTWGFIMRKVQQEVEKQRAAEEAKTS